MSFHDTFNRTDRTDVGNGWLFQNRHEGQTLTHPWRIVGGILKPPVGDLSTICYRAHDVDAYGTFKVIWTLKNTVGDNNAQMFFRYTTGATLSQRRYAIKLVGTTGSLVRQFWRTVDGTQTESAPLASWTRTASNEAVITLECADNGSITIYDSGFAGTDHKAAELIDLTWAQYTGVGVSQGSYDDINIIPVEGVRAAVFDPDDISCRVRASVRVDLADHDVLTPRPAVRNQEVVVGPYIVLDGTPELPVALSELGAGLSWSSLTPVSSASPPLPSEVVVGSTTRFSPAGGGMSAAGGALSITAGGTAMPAYTPAYTYTSAHGKLVRPALAMTGRSYLRLAGFTGSPSRDNFSVAIVAVLRGNTGKHYGLISTDQNDEVDGAGLGDPLDVFYSHGLITIHGGSRVLAHESVKEVGYPTVVVLSVNTTTETGRILIQDRRRTMKAFSTKGLDTSGRLFFGATMHVLDEFTEDEAGELEVLEIDYWTSALDAYGMLEANNVLSTCYGVT